MKEKLTIVKVGGAVVEDDAQLGALLSSFSQIEGHRLLVHGGGRRATSVASQLGIETRMVEGRRITDAEMLQVVTMVYGGLVNKHIVALLSSMGMPAMGLTGADGNAVLATRRAPLNGIDYGFVGDVRTVNAALLKALIGSGLVPVMAPLTCDGQGHLLNTNADTIASEVAKAMARLFDVTLIYAFEKPGVLKDGNDDSSLIAHIDSRTFARYRAEGVVSGGMVPKIENALHAVEAGVERVLITRWDAIDGRHGTVISL